VIVDDGNGRRRYVVVSADSHAGAALREYKPYLEGRWHEEFDAWADAYVDPWLGFEDAQRIGGSASSGLESNWNSELRQSRVEGEGIVGEVLYPNTVPPFYPSKGALVAPNPSSRDDYEHRLAGLRAHNRWLADYCAEVPGRRAGIGQFFLNDLDAALEDVRFAKENGLTGGVLLPGTPPGSGLPPMHDPHYEPLWQLCEDLDIPLNHHTVPSAAPGYAPHTSATDQAWATIGYLELRFWVHRPLWHLIFSGVFERHPGLKFIFSEQGAAWVIPTLGNLDRMALRLRTVGTAENTLGGEGMKALHHTPSEYFARNCYLGASFLTPKEASLRHEIGVDRIMWGSDFPHSEGVYPYTNEALRATFAGIPEDEVSVMLGDAAMAVYEFDTHALTEAAAAFGPLVDDVATPLSGYPAESFSPVFETYLADVIPSW
jgi:predicted TIM-barrel fold metal-dependent hydrolase